MTEQYLNKCVSIGVSKGKPRLLGLLSGMVVQSLTESRFGCITSLKMSSSSLQEKEQGGIYIIDGHYRKLGVENEQG